MTTHQTSSLENRILRRWAGDAPGGDRAQGGRGERRHDVSYRPGYSVFKALLLMALFLAVSLVFPWLPARAGNGIPMKAAGFMYVSVPLHATEPRFEETTINFDFVGAGINILRIEMAQHSDETRFVSGRKRKQDWRRRRAALKAYPLKPTFKPVRRAARKPVKRASASRRDSAKRRYLALLEAYRKEPSSAQRRALYGDLIAAYEAALSATSRRQAR